MGFELITGDVLLHRELAGNGHVLSKKDTGFWEWRAGVFKDMV